MHLQRHALTSWQVDKWVGAAFGENIMGMYSSVTELFPSAETVNLEIIAP